MIPYHSFGLECIPRRGNQSPSFTSFRMGARVSHCFPRHAQKTAEDSLQKKIGRSQTDEPKDDAMRSRMSRHRIPV